jgi:hypothetical protein
MNLSLFLTGNVLQQKYHNDRPGKAMPLLMEGAQWMS